MRVTVAVFALFAAAAGAATAQEYPPAAPAPRTTSAPQLRALARAREVHERFRLGLVAQQHGQWAQSAAEFERILSIAPPEPQFSTAAYDLGIAYANLHRLDDAAREFKTAIDRDPGFLAAMANLVAVDLSRGDVTEARAMADRFVAAAPDSARALYSQGLTALRGGDLAAAERSFSTLLRNDPQYAVAHYDLGVTQARMQRYLSAQREFELALDLAPSYARARFALGTVLLREGKRTQARAAFDRVVRDANGDPALLNLALSMRDAIKAP